MVANTKAERFSEKIEYSGLYKESRFYRLRTILLVFLALELLPALLNMARGLQSPFFSPANINQHVYHHIHFLVFGFPVGLAIWLVMDWRVRRLEKRLLQLSPLALTDVKKPATRGARLLCWLPQAVLLFCFWMGWDDLKFHYLSRYWSLIHELLVWLK